MSTSARQRRRGGPAQTSPSDAPSRASSRAQPSTSTSLPATVLALVVAVLLVLLVHTRNGSLPAVREAADTPAHEFSEGRAREHLAALVACGVRTVGSHANEVCATEYIERTVRALEGLNAEVEVEVEVQRPSGAFSTVFLDGYVDRRERTWHGAHTHTLALTTMRPPAFDIGFVAVLQL